MNEESIVEQKRNSPPRGAGGPKKRRRYSSALFKYRIIFQVNLMVSEPANPYLAANLSFCPALEVTPPIKEY